MESDLYYVKMNNEIYGPYSEEEMASFDIPDDTPVTTDPDGEWSTFVQLGFSSNNKEEAPFVDNSQDESLQTGVIEDGSMQVEDKKSDALKDIFFGLLWCVGGIIVTVVTYSNASGGGTYVVAWGAILFGGIQFLKGLFHLIF